MAALTAVLSVGLFNQARALKCYQAPLSWGSCWTDPNAGVFVFSVYLVYSKPCCPAPCTCNEDRTITPSERDSRRFRGDSRFQVDFVASQNFASTAFNAREKCTVPCGGVGLMPREKVPPYELKTSCSACTACNPFSSGSGSAPLIEEKQACETVGCCEWDSDKEKCNAAKTGLCNASHVDTVLSIQSGIACKNLPALGVSPWTANAVDAGFELRECGNPTDVCASYCVAIHSPWGTNSEDQVSCSHGCLPKSVPSKNGAKRAEELLEELFKTSLALEDFYWCVSDECQLAPADSIKKRDSTCTLHGCLYTGPASITGNKKGVPLCDNKFGPKEDYKSCQFRVCTTDGCNFSAAPSNLPHALAAVISGVLSLTGSRRS